MSLLPRAKSLLGLSAHTALPWGCGQVSTACPLPSLKPMHRLPAPRSIFSTETTHGCDCCHHWGRDYCGRSSVPWGQWSLWVRPPKKQPGRGTDVLATSVGLLQRQPQCGGFCSPSVFCVTAIDDGPLDLSGEQGNRKITPGPQGGVSDPEDHTCHFPM